MFFARLVLFAVFCQVSAQSYVATFPNDLPIRGTITMTEFQTGIKFVIALTHEDGAGPSGFNFHLHQRQISGDWGSGSTCDTAGGHYDPGNVEGNNYDCDSNNFDTCYKGDLSGKFSPLAFPTGALEHTDPSISIDDVDGLSIVIHSNTDPTQRFACASVLGQGTQIGSGGDNLPGGSNFIHPEANGGTTFLIYFVYFIGFGCGIYALFQIIMNPVQSKFSQEIKRLSSDTRSAMKKYGVKSPPNRKPPTVASRSERADSNDTILTVNTVPDVSAYSKPPSRRPVPGPPPPRNLSMRDPALSMMSTVSSLTGAPPLPPEKQRAFVE